MILLCPYVLENYFAEAIRYIVIAGRKVNWLNSFIQASGKQTCSYLKISIISAFRR